MQTDEALAARVATGDEIALRELLRRYQGPLAAFLYRQTGGRDVEDLYQETWLRVARHAAAFDAGRRFSTWLFQIAVNLCRDWHRRPPPEPRPLASEATAADWERTEAALDAAQLLARLPAAQREVVILRYYHDLSENDVAAILNIPRGTVKSRLHEAIARLSAIVRAEKEGPA
jgi:RNA polymerase sigma-70 factor (ECF subfamily)